MTDFAQIIIAIISLIVAPIITLLVWTIRKLVQAQIDYVKILSDEFASFSAEFTSIDTNLRTLRNEVAKLRSKFDDFDNPKRNTE